MAGERGDGAVVTDHRRWQRHAEGVLQRHESLHGLERCPPEAPEGLVPPDRGGREPQHTRPHIPYDLLGLAPRPRRRHRYRRGGPGTVRGMGPGTVRKRGPGTIRRISFRTGRSRFPATCRSRFPGTSCRRTPATGRGGTSAPRPPLTRLEPLPQSLPLQLPARRTGKCPRRQGQHPYIVVEQCLAHPGGDPFEHLRGPARRPGPRDEHHDAFPTGHGIGRADHRRSTGRQPRGGRRDPLHVRGVEGAAVEEQHVLVAPRHAQPSVPQEAEIAGAQPPVGERLGAHAGKTVVATGQLRTAHHDVPDPPVTKLRAPVVDDPHGAARHRRPDVHQLDGARARHGPLAGHGVHRHTPAQRGTVQDQRLGHFPGGGNVTASVASASP